MEGNTVVYGFMIWIAQGGQSQVLTICFYDYLMCNNIENCMVKKGSCSGYKFYPRFPFGSMNELENYKHSSP